MSMRLSRRAFVAGAGSSVALMATVHAQVAAAPLTVIRNVRIFDGTGAALLAGSVLVEGRFIKAIERGDVAPPPGATVVEGGGRVLMPGLTDAHWHTGLAANSFANWQMADPGLAYANMVAEAERTLMRGFTTVRDMMSPAFGLKQAIDTGKAVGPRIFPSGAFISQSSGHGDFDPLHQFPGTLGGAGSQMEELGMFQIANGVPEVLAACRMQLKKGASQLKIGAGGGFASTFDPADSLQLSPEEQRAAVQAATDWGTYVAAHVYTAAGIKRAVESGVRSIEHGHLADDVALKMMVDKDVWLSLQPFGDSKAPDGPELEERRRKKGIALSGADWARTLTRARQIGTKVAFGTDILFQPVDGAAQTDSLIRFTQALSAADTLHIATARNGELFALSGNRNPYREAKLGVIQKGAWADMLLIRGNPVEDISLLRDFENNIVMIMKDGVLFKNLV